MPNATHAVMLGKDKAQRLPAVFSSVEGEKRLCDQKSNGF